MPVGPKGCAVEGIQKPITIGAEDWHFASCSHQEILQVIAVGKFRFRLSKPGSEGNCAARAHFRKLSDDINGQVSIDADKGSVRSRWKPVKRPVDTLAFNLIMVGVNRPERAVEPELLALADNAPAPRTTTNDGN